MRTIRALALAGVLLPLGACVSLVPDAEMPAVVAEMPTAYDAAEIDGTYRPANWWQAYGDPVLDGLVNDALSDNLDITAAAARVEQASAQARIARSAMLPTVSASASTSYSDSPLAGSAFGGLSGGGPSRLTNETYSLSLGAAYELDLFGRARGDLAAARSDAVAAEFDYRTVQLASAAETISTYFEIVDTRRQIELTVRTAELLADRAERTNDRFLRGLSESFELYQVRQDLRNTQASLPQLEASLGAANGRLATLVGTYPGPMKARLETQLTPRLVFAPVPAGLPAELLVQRPDVAAEWARLESARQRIGARRAERFPSLQLTGSLGTQGDSPLGIFDIADTWLLSLGSSITAPLLDGGRISANIRAARAAYDAQAAAYAKAVLTAYREVDVAIDDYEEQRQRYLLITGQLAEAKASLDVQSSRFQSGVGSYTAYLDALRAVYQVESSLSGAARGVALSRLGIHRALGGDWAATATPDVSDTPQTDDSEGNLQ